MRAVETKNWSHRQIVYSSKFLRLEYSGPDLSNISVRPNRVVVVFAPYDYPFDMAIEGWGSSSFTKRAIAHVCVFHRDEDWYQNPDFFEAMATCRSYLGGDIDITTYGFSMGGYGAILSADSLSAERAVAISPQFSIDPAIVPFERRYSDQWHALDTWRYDMHQHRTDPSRRILICLDPMHQQDRKQAALFPARPGHHRILLHGSGHAGIQTMVEMGIIDTLFDLLCGRATEKNLRQAYRHARRDSFRYLRKVGNALHQKRHPMAPQFLEWAKAKGFHRLIKKWRDYYA